MQTESVTAVLEVQPNRKMHKELFFRNTTIVNLEKEFFYG